MNNDTTYIIRVYLRDSIYEEYKYTAVFDGYDGAPIDHETPSQDPIGHGDTPNEAMIDLMESQAEKKRRPDCHKTTTKRQLNKCAFALGVATGGIVSMLDEANDKNHLTPSLIKLKDFLMKQCDDIFYKEMS